MDMRRMSLTRLILIPPTVGEPAPFLVVDAAGQVLERGVLTSEEVDVPLALTTVAIVPGADVLVRWLDLPAGRTEQQRTAALWLLRDDLAAPPERVGVAMGTSAASRLVAVANRSLVDAWIDYLDALGVKADVLLPDVLAISEPFDDDQLTAVAFGPYTALRGRHFAASVQPDLIDLIAGGRTVLSIQDRSSIEGMLIEAAQRPAINLLDIHGAARPDSPGRWRRTAIAAAVLVLSPLVLTLAASARDDWKAARLSHRTAAVARAALPGLAPSTDPVAELQRRLAVAPPPGGIAGVSAALFAAIQSVEGAEIDSLVSDAQGVVRATISYPSPQDMVTIKAGVAKAGLALSDTSTQQDGNRIVSDVRIGGSA